MIPLLSQAPRPLHRSTIASSDTKPRMAGGAGITPGPLQTGHNWDALHVRPDRHPGDGVLQPVWLTVRRRDPAQRGHKPKMKSCLSVKTRFDRKKWPDKRRSDGLSADSASWLRRARRRSLHMGPPCRVPNQGRSGRDVPGPGKGAGGNAASGDSDPGEAELS